MKLEFVAIAACLVVATGCENLQPRLPPGQALVKGDGHKRAGAEARDDQAAREAAEREAAERAAAERARLANGEGVETPSLHVAKEIAEMCRLPAFKSSPHFEFDSASLAPEDRDVLAALAKCMSDGPLRGRTLALVGRTDPRGETEYNFGLGEARANSVLRYLHDLGIEPQRVAPSSRGELDAQGKDETTWAHDRRVDIEMAAR